MAEQADNPYARLYGRPAHENYDPTTIPHQQDQSYSSQPQLQDPAQQAWDNQVQSQLSTGLSWLDHAQHVPPAHGSMTHAPADSSAPPWQAAAPAQHGPPAQDSIMHEPAAFSASPWQSAASAQHGQPANDSGTCPSHRSPGYPSLAAELQHRKPSLQRERTAQHPSSDKAVRHNQSTTQTLEAAGRPNTPLVSQRQGAERSAAAPEEPPNKRQRFSTRSADPQNSSSRHDAENSQHQTSHMDAGPPPGVRRESQQDQKTVLIWDVDETLVLFQSLLDGSFAQAFGMQDPEIAKQLGERWQDAIMDLCDNELLFAQLEAADQTTLTSLQEYDDGMPLSELSLPDQPVSVPLDDVSRRQLAHAYRLIRHKYGKGLSKLSDDKRWPETVAQLKRLVRDTDAISGNWLSHAKQLLHHCQGVEHAEHWVHQVVVTTGQLIPTLAKLLICGLDAYLPAEGIYSARDETKDHCFRLIEDSHGPHTKYCVIGDGPEERRCAEARGWPFVQVALSAGQQTTVKGMRLTSIMAKDVLKAAHQ